MDKSISITHYEPLNDLKNTICRRDDGQNLKTDRRIDTITAKSLGSPQRQLIHSDVKEPLLKKNTPDTIAAVSSGTMPLAGKQTLEAFIDYIESDSLKRKHWLSRVREAGFDQALSEYREMTAPQEISMQP